MADVAVESLLGKLRQLLIYQPYLISADVAVEDELKQLESDLSLLKPFLTDSTEQRRKDDGGVKELLRAIHDVVYQAEDIIDSFLMQEAERRQRRIYISDRWGVNFFRRSSKSTDPTVSDQLRSVRSQLTEINKRTIGIEASITAAAGDDWSPLQTQQAFSIRDDTLVGFKYDTEILIGYLTEESQQLDAISIIGMSGLGKTALAWKIFRDPRIKSEFPTLVWVCISPELTMKDVFLAILDELGCTEDVLERTSRELARVVASNLENKKFLIVVDNLESVYYWDQIETALPKGNNTGYKVLITSRNEEVGWRVSRSRPPHKLRALSKEESWLLLESEVFDGCKCPHQLEELGRLIAEQCDGLPLALVVMGGVLKRDYSSSLDETTVAWTKAYQSIHFYVNQRLYEGLPDQLRDCFLYLGVFPDGYEIPVAKLISLWVAEGFIPQKEGWSLEETAGRYLEQLINMNLIKIEKFKSDGKARTCRIRHKLREFCKTEAGLEKENLFQEINKSNVGLFEPPLSELNKFRRLCIHSNVLDFFSSSPNAQRARSFLCFAKDVCPSPGTRLAIEGFFRLLRVLDLNPVKFSEIPKGIDKLIHLRYIALSIIDLSVLPAAFNKFWNIQTLIIDTNCPTLQIKADIWKMKQLRCLTTKASASLTPPSRTDDSEGKQLQTLGTISPQSCTKEFFEKACNLKQLSIRGRLALLLDGTTGSFDSLTNLSNLEKLKLINDANLSSEGRLIVLPPAPKFPSKLNHLTLSGTLLEWDQMSILGSIQSLKVLKIKHKAFTGKTWDVADNDNFLNLEVLHIRRTDLVSWNASGHRFPKLRRLLLQNCEELKEVPIGLADVPTLQLLDLNGAKLAVPSAKKIHEVIRRNLEQKKIKDNAFKLSISPADE